MKNLIKLCLLLCTIFAMSCNTDPCKDVVCGDEGTCVDGTCDCNFGYEKDADNLCNTPWAMKFVGSNLSATDSCYGGSQNVGVYVYATNITMTDATTLSSTNLFGYGSSNVIDVDVTSSNEVSINYTDVAGRIFSGSGMKSGNTLTMDVVVQFPGGGADTCKTMVNY